MQKLKYSLTLNCAGLLGNTKYNFCYFIINKYVKYYLTVPGDRVEPAKPVGDCGEVAEIEQGLLRGGADAVVHNLVVKIMLLFVQYS